MTNVQSDSAQLFRLNNHVDVLQFEDRVVEILAPSQPAQLRLRTRAETSADTLFRFDEPFFVVANPAGGDTGFTS